jgi:hypothetical protein
LFGICLNQNTRDWYGTARVSKRPSHKSAACLRARYRTGIPMLCVSNHQTAFMPNNLAISGKTASARA